MFQRSISLRIHMRTDTESFLYKHRELVSTIAKIFRTSEQLVTFFIRRGLTDVHGENDSPELRVSLAVRRWDGSFIPTDELRSSIHLELERLQTFVDVTTDSVRSLCRHQPAVSNGSSVVVPVALGLTYVYFNVSLTPQCLVGLPQESCSSLTCSKFEECVSTGDDFRCRCLFSGKFFKKYYAQLFCHGLWIVHYSLVCWFWEVFF